MVKLAAPELVSGISGESEQRIRQVFQFAQVRFACSRAVSVVITNQSSVLVLVLSRPSQENAPCVLFVDEIDAITPRRETAGKEMERRIVSQLLACIDGIALQLWLELHCSHVLVRVIVLYSVELACRSREFKCGGGRAQCAARRRHEPRGRARPGAPARGPLRP